MHKDFRTLHAEINNKNDKDIRDPDSRVSNDISCGLVLDLV